jgi:hypothetical protein
LTLLHSVLYPSASYDLLKPILLAAPLPKSRLDHNKTKMHVAMIFKLGIITCLICIWDVTKRNHGPSTWWLVVHRQ